MQHLPLPAVIDANVLFSFILRDTILRAAEAGLCQPYWSEEILAEASRNLISQGRITSADATRLWTLMNEVFPEANVTGYEKHLPGLTNNGKDRHVVAAALEAGVPFVVTGDLDDFVPLPEGLRAMSADTFLLELFNRAPDQMIDVLHFQVADFRHPPSNSRSS